MLRDGESNPGLPRDRRGYSPLYYRGDWLWDAFYYIYNFLQKLVCLHSYWLTVPALYRGLKKLELNQSSADDSVRSFRLHTECRRSSVPGSFNFSKLYFRRTTTNSEIKSTTNKTASNHIQNGMHFQNGSHAFIFTIWMFSVAVLFLK